MNLKSGYPFSLVRFGIPFDYPKLEKNTHTDVLIIGAGISGALVAHHLMEAGIDCMMVDGRSVGLGSTCASTSLLQYELDTSLYQLGEMIGEMNAVQAYRVCERSIHGLARVARQVGHTDFRNKKSLQFAALKKHGPALLKEFELRKKHGFRLEFLTARELKKEFQLDAPCALYTEPAADTDSYIFTHRILQYNMKRGLQVFDRTPAISFAYAKNKTVVTTKSGHRVKCRYLVFANGYEAAQQVPDRLVSLQTTFVTISESRNKPLPFWKDDCLIWSSGQPYHYIRSTPDARVLIGGRDEKIVSAARMEKLIPSKSRTLARDFEKLLPQIEFIPEFSWAGVFATTRDGLPFIGKHPGRPNTFFALGFGGNGITFSQVAAEMITSLLLEKKHPDAGIFGFERTGLEH